MKKVNSFKYLGSHMTSDGSVENEIKQGIQSGQINWKNTSRVV
jgi:hypothetical protein